MSAAVPSVSRYFNPFIYHGKHFKHTFVQPGYLSLAEAEKRASSRARAQQREYEQQLREAKDHIEAKTRANRTSLVYASSDRARREQKRRQALARVAGVLRRASNSSDAEFERGGSFDGVFDEGELVEAQLAAAENQSTGFDED
jgi:hypothetical protein